MTIVLAPSILSADFGRLADQVREAVDGGADWIHVDVMDGHFVPNITVGPAITAAVREVTDHTVDVHLMIENPERYIEAFAEAGADIITVHQEACRHLHRTVEQIRELELRPGVALNPATAVETLVEITPFVDLVLIMTVNPGFGGQTFIPTTLDKIRRTRALLDRQHAAAWLQVDGGIDELSAPLAVEAGATSLVAGSAVFGHEEGPAAGLAVLEKAVASVRMRRV